MRRTLVSGVHAAPHTHWIMTRVHRKRAEATLCEREPILALIKEWCERAAVEEFAEVLAPRKEVNRLHELIADTVRWLCQSWHPAKAALLLKELDRTSNSARMGSAAPCELSPILTGHLELSRRHVRGIAQAARANMLQDKNLQ